jgi:hypothetical protein
LGKVSGCFSFFLSPLLTKSRRLRLNAYPPHWPIPRTGLGLAEPQWASAWEKPPTSSFRNLGPNSARVNLQTQQVSTTQHIPSHEYYPVQLLDRLHSAPPPTKPNDIDSEYNSLLSAGMGRDTEPTAESRGGVSRTLRVGVGEKTTSQSGGTMDHWAYLMGLWTAHNTELPQLLGELADSQSCGCRATQLQPGENSNSNLVVSDHRSQLQPALWAEVTNNCSQTSFLVRPLQTWEDTETTKWTQRGLQKISKWNKEDYETRDMWNKKDSTR